MSGMPGPLTPQLFGFWPTKFDQLVSKPNPGYTLNGTETGNAWSEFREVGGVTWLTNNAQFNQAAGGFLQVNQTLPSSAIQLTAGAAQFLTAAAGATGVIVWTGSGTNAGGRTYNALELGCAGTGVDDSATIQEIATDIGEAGGGILYLPAPPVTYGIKNYFLLPSNCTLQGDGRYLTTMTLLPGGTANLSNMIVGNTLWNTNHGFINQKNIWIKDIGFNGGNAVSSGNAQSAVYLRGVYGQGVINCDFFNCAGCGIDIYCQLGPFTTPNPTGNFFIFNNTINLNYLTTPLTSGENGIFPIVTKGIGLGQIAFNRIGDLCTARTNDAIDTPFCNDVSIFGNYMTMCEDGIGSNGTQNWFVSGNDIVSPHGYGISTFGSNADGGVNNAQVNDNNISNCYNKTAIRISTINQNPITGFPGSPVSEDFTVNDNIINGVLVSGIHIEANSGKVDGNVINMAGSGLTYLTPGLGTGSGIWLDNNNLGGNFVSVTNNIIYNGGASSVGIRAGQDGPNFGCHLSANNVSGVTTPMMNPHNNMPNSVIRNNVGINPWGLIASAPAISFNAPVVNTTPFDARISVYGGSVTTIKITGTDTHQTSGMFNVPVGDSIEVDGSGASWVWIGN